MDTVIHLISDRQFSYDFIKLWEILFFCILSAYAFARPTLSLHRRLYARTIKIVLAWARDTSI